jgi:hypothetical protein
MCEDAGRHGGVEAGKRGGLELWNIETLEPGTLEPGTWNPGTRNTENLELLFVEDNQK